MCPEYQIDSHFVDKPVGDSETLEKTIKGKKLLIQWLKCNKFVTKIIYNNGVEDHVKFKW